jgi:enoyl-CoA hydratase/carnithine racemase
VKHSPLGRHAGGCNTPERPGFDDACHYAFDAVGFERDVCKVARKLAAKPVRALQASKRLMKWSFREQIKAAMEAETQEFSALVRSDEAREAFAAFLEKHRLSAEAVR